MLTGVPIHYNVTRLEGESSAIGADASGRLYLAVIPGACFHYHVELVQNFLALSFSFTSKK